MFDPYHKWLGIPAKDQPPNHYRLLGIDLFESDPDVIDAAANKQMAYIQVCATGLHVALSQKLLNELAAARLCLLDPTKKSNYDTQYFGIGAGTKGRRRETNAFTDSEPAAIDVAPPEYQYSEGALPEYRYSDDAPPEYQYSDDALPEYEYSEPTHRWHAGLLIAAILALLFLAAMLFAVVLMSRSPPAPEDQKPQQQPAPQQENPNPDHQPLEPVDIAKPEPLQDKVPAEPEDMVPAEPKDQRKPKSTLPQQKLPPLNHQKLAITSAVLKKKFRGSAVYDDKTATLKLSYDFASKDQLKDFNVGAAKPVIVRRFLNIKGPWLTLKGGERIKHIVNFTEVTVTGLVGVGSMRGHPSRSLLATTGGVAFFLGGLNFDTIYLEAKNERRTVQFIVPAYERRGILRIVLAVLPHRLAFVYGNSKLEMSVKEARAGQIELAGGDLGYAYGRFTLKGKMDEEWAKQFFANPK
jgi:hypothetical protein